MHYTLMSEESRYKTLRIPLHHGKRSNLLLVLSLAMIALLSNTHACTSLLFRNYVLTPPLGDSSIDSRRRPTVVFLQ
jgi:hypothetical protein